MKQGTFVFSLVLCSLIPALLCQETLPTDATKSPTASASSENVKSRLLSALTSPSSSPLPTKAGDLIPATKVGNDFVSSPATTPLLPTLPPEWKCQLQSDYLCKILEKTLRMNLKKTQIQNTTLTSDVEVGNQTYRVGQTAEEEFYKYYTVKVISPAEGGSSYWVDFDKLKPGSVRTKPELIGSHRKASHVGLNFDFPFYGMARRTVTITTGGFLYLGDQLHSWLAASQFVAPLMGNFQTTNISVPNEWINSSSTENPSVIHFFDNGTAFTVEWRNVTLVDQPQLGRFSFQATLKDSGDIVFAYGSIPVKISEISNGSHPVKIGISDAYTINHDILYLRRKTIYEYHRVDMKEKHEDSVVNGTAIYFTAHKTCVSFNDCTSCLSANVSFECMWCPQVQRCSDGFDRFRQDWHASGCDKVFLTSPDHCPADPVAVPPTGGAKTSPVTSDRTGGFGGSTTDGSASDQFPGSGASYPLRPGGLPNSKYDQMSKPTPGTSELESPAVSSKASLSDKEVDGASVGSGSAGVVASILVAVTAVSLILWLVYAYKFPHSSSGQLLIRYRPSQWRMFRREVRYTATSLHM